MYTLLINPEFSIAKDYIEIDISQGKEKINCEKVTSRKGSLKLCLVLMSGEFELDRNKTSNCGFAGNQNNFFPIINVNRLMVL